MPHATPAQDDEEVTQAVKYIQQTRGDDENGDESYGNYVTFDSWGGSFDPGEKADDAVDYADIDDDDLPDEEKTSAGVAAIDAGDPRKGVARLEPSSDLALGSVPDQDSFTTHTNGPTQDDALHGPGDDFQDDADLDDLFFEQPSSPTAAPQDIDASSPLTATRDTNAGAQNDERPAAGTQSFDSTVPASSGTAVQDFATSQASAPKPDQQLFRQINFGSQHESIEAPAPPESLEEALAAMWPDFKRDETPKFVRMLPMKKARFVGKTPLRPPKPLQLTKVALELAPDQEQLFNSYGPPSPSREDRLLEAAEKGLVLNLPEEPPKEKDFSVPRAEDIDDNERIGNVTWRDLKLICTDWDSLLDRQDEEAQKPQEEPASQEGDDWEMEYGEQPPKQKASTSDSLIRPLAQWFVPELDEPELTAAQLAKKVVVDLNDPKTIVEIQKQGKAEKKVPRIGRDFKRGGATKFVPQFFRRFNNANDVAYDLLKENHLNKVRSVLGNLTVEHSLPALRLQYPYYKVKLGRQEARSFHRPAMSFTPGVPVRFSKPKTLKRKRMKDQDAASMFRNTKDLSLADNSNALLLEYSEEYPTMMSNFGMASRLINYYRRKSPEDSSRPKLDIGETAVLMPQDRSPFSIFGHIDPGETVPTLYNAMFRAPVFKQVVHPTDFLVIRNTTGVEGSSWYMRNVENLYVVGQQFPSVDVPGPHSRKVTTASKSRLKMIAYRKVRKNATHRVSVAEITEHFPETTDMQNRQKMKDFMQFNKEYKEWEMKEGEAIPDEAAIRAMLTPEDACLLEASQVGLQHLQDAGYGKDADLSDDDDAREGQSLEEQLAPWKTTRNFIHATQGKAMLQLHGEGDPSGRGEAFSFIRTSMKGGFKAMGESVEDKIDARKMKELGGHSYNVARQQKAYDDSIRRIWEAQKKGLSSQEKHGDADKDDDMPDAPDDAADEGRTPMSEAVPGATPGAAAPALGPRGDDDAVSQFSKFSAATERGKILRITRMVSKDGGPAEPVTEVIRDPRVLRGYLKRRHAIEAEILPLSELQPTGNAEEDKRAKKRIAEELARLERNKDRSLARDKQKGSFIQQQLQQQDIAASPTGAKSPAPAVSAASPSNAPSPAPATPTPTSAASKRSSVTDRTCASCGQKGHIKTNKACPNHPLHNEPDRKRKRVRSKKTDDQEQQPQTPTAVADNNISFSNGE